MLISEMYSKYESFCHQYLQEPDDFLDDEQSEKKESDKENISALS